MKSDHQQDPVGIFHDHGFQKSYYKPIDQGGVELAGPQAMLKKKKKGKKKKPKKQKSTNLQTDTDKEVIQSVPRSLVFHRSSIPVGKHLKKLEENLKAVMLPYTALKTDVSPKATFKDIVSYATKVYITHFLIFSLTELSPMLKIAKLPLGPTLTFRVKEYSTRDQLNDFRAGLKRSFGLNYTHYTDPMKANPPLVIMNKFSAKYTEGKPYLKVIQSTLQHMFPPLDLDSFQLHNRRVVLFEYNPDENVIEWRHYAITLRSEDAENELSTEKVESALKKKKIALEELGPRLTLELYKIESEFMEGDVLYHSSISKTEEEEKELKEKRHREKAEKEQRKKQQEANVQRKKEEQEQKRLEKLQKAERSLQKALESIEQEKNDIDAQAGLDEIAANDEVGTYPAEIQEQQKQHNEDAAEDEDEQASAAESVEEKPKKKKKKSKKRKRSAASSDEESSSKHKKKKSKKKKSKRKKSEE